MIRVFYHIFCNEFTRDIVQDQISKLIFSGVYARVDIIHCFCTGPFLREIAQLLLESGSKFRIQEAQANDSTAERFTLSRIATLLEPNDKFLYMHSKGVTRCAQRFDNPQIRKDVLQRIADWRTFMEYHLLVRHAVCLEALDTHDCVGVNWRYWDIPLSDETLRDRFAGKKGIHFSGNMWWCTASYWKQLPSTIGPDYNDPEFHIGLGGPRVLCLAEAGVDHYYSRVPLRSYV